MHAYRNKFFFKSLKSHSSSHHVEITTVNIFGLTPCSLFLAYVYIVPCNILIGKNLLIILHFAFFN